MMRYTAFTGVVVVTMLALVACGGPEGGSGGGSGESGSGEIQAIAAGEAFTCVAKTDGTVYCWGSNEYDSLGGGGERSGVGESTPGKVAKIESAVDLAAGERHVCALTEQGGVWCWGSNLAGELGVSSDQSGETPVKVEGVDNAVDVSGGFKQSCALLESGQVKCWGEGRYLGAEKLGEDTPPQTVPGIDSAVSLSGGRGPTCAVLESGLVKCWEYEVEEVEGISQAVSVSVGDNHRCAVLKSGKVTCWGENDTGQLGRGRTATREPGGELEGLDSVTSISAGAKHTCSLNESGDVACWGDGDGAGVLDPEGSSIITQMVYTPRMVEGVSDVVMFDAGEYHTCVVVDGGEVYCWGTNDRGQLGNGTEEDSRKPVKVKF